MGIHRRPGSCRKGSLTMAGCAITDFVANEPCHIASFAIFFFSIVQEQIIKIGVFPVSLRSPEYTYAPGHLLPSPGRDKQRLLAPHPT